MDQTEHEALIAAIESRHGCPARWIVSVPVMESHEGRVLWEGEVELFELIDHPSARRAYAWSHASGGGERKYYVVLQQGPVRGAHDAVRAAIVADRRSGRAK